MDKKTHQNYYNEVVLQNIIGDDRTMIEKNHIFTIHKYSW